MAPFYKLGSGLFYLFLFVLGETGYLGHVLLLAASEVQKPTPVCRAYFKPLPMAHAMVLLSRAIHMTKPNVSGVGNTVCL